MRLSFLATTLVLGLAALPATASEDVDHYAAEPSESLAEALRTLENFNAKVAAVVERDNLSVADMEQVHQYTYTMEEAVARIATEMEDIATALEEVHLGSEGDDPAALRATTATYLEMTAPLTR